jgi:hypothetical protein
MSEHDGKSHFCFECKEALESERDLLRKQIVDRENSIECFKLAVNTQTDLYRASLVEIDNLRGYLYENERAPVLKPLRDEIDKLRAGLDTTRAHYSNIAAASEKDRDHWKEEYENLCKFASDYENQSIKWKALAAVLDGALRSAKESNPYGLNTGIDSALAAYEKTLEGK